MAGHCATRHSMGRLRYRLDWSIGLSSLLVLAGKSPGDDIPIPGPADIIASAGRALGLYDPWEGGHLYPFQGIAPDPVDDPWGRHRPAAWNGHLIV
jgi:hypothetical protein